jgi:hypothetical protein
VDIAASIIAIVFTWRFLLSLAISIAFAFLLAQFSGPVASFSAVCIGVGFGGIWQGRWLSGMGLLDSAQSQPVSKPITFLGFAFIGAIWGGLAGDLCGSTLIGVLVLVATVALAGAWLTLVLKRNTDLLKLAFAALSLIAGVCGVYLYGLNHV